MVNDMEFKARLGKDKKRDISFPRTEQRKVMRNGVPSEETVQIGEGRIGPLHHEEEVNLDEIRRMEGLFDQGYLELYTMEGTKTTITDVLYDGVAPALTPTLLRHYGREQLVKLADQFGMETREIGAGDDKPHDKATRAIRGELTAFVMSPDYERWRLENEERLQRESIHDRTRKAEKAASDADEARRLAEEQLAAAQEELAAMKGDDGDEEEESTGDDDREPEGEPEAPLTGGVPTAPPGRDGRPPLWTPDGPPAPDLTASLDGVPAADMVKTPVGALAPEPVVASVEPLVAKPADDPDEVILPLDDNEDLGDEEVVDEAEFTESKLMHLGHPELQEQATELGLEEPADWTKKQLVYFIRFRKGLMEYEEIPDKDVQAEVEDYLEPEPVDS